MDEFIGKLSLYDYLVRLIAGGITILEHTILIL